MSDYTIQSGDNLYNIVKKQYGFKNPADIMNMINKIAKNNNIKNLNIIHPNQTIKLPEQLKLDTVSISNPQKSSVQTLKDTTGNTNYYRANSIFGDIATKPEYNQSFVPSNLKKITQSTAEVEDVKINVHPEFTSDTNRDMQAYDIAAKPAGVGGFKEMNNTDAYKMFLEVNADDFTVRETEYKGKKEAKAYLDRTKTDGKITVFSSELINGKEFLAIRDKEGLVHYFDKENGLKECKPE